MVMKKVLEHKTEAVGFSIILFLGTIAVPLAGYSAQNCIIDTKQNGSNDTSGVNTAVLDAIKEIVDRCVFAFSIIAALFVGFTTLAAVILGAIFSKWLLVGPSTNISAYYDRSSKPDTCKLVLRFDRPVTAQNPQRMVLLYRYADGMAATVPGQQCGGSGLTLAFTANTEGLPTRMELVICPGAMHPVGFPESDVCTNGRPIHVDVDILRCDT